MDVCVSRHDVSDPLATIHTGSYVVPLFPLSKMLARASQLVVVPRVGTEFDAALANSGSSSLAALSGMTASWEAVQAQALGGELRVDAESLSPGARVESHYPVRVCVGSFEFGAASVDGALRFEVLKMTYHVKFPTLHH